MNEYIVLFLTCSSVLTTVAICCLIGNQLGQQKEQGKFAEWTQINGFYYDTYCESWTNKYDKSFENMYKTYTTDELIKLWKKG